MDKPQKRGRGRPRTVTIKKDEFDKLASFGCTLYELAAWFNCSEDTIERWCAREMGQRFKDYYRSKEAIGLISLRRKQFQIAMEGHPGMLIWLGKQKLGQSDKAEQTIQTEEIGGASKAIADLLKTIDKTQLFQLREAVANLTGPKANKTDG